ncbi:MAG: hypothetical protein IT445_02010 [Phycisphaeraceae bacterium]|nr:hypothetical protein [Phycisphaeraceae bacterium]
MSRMFDRIRRIPGMLAHGLFLYNMLEYLSSKGLVIRPFYFFQEQLDQAPAASKFEPPPGFELVELQPSDCGQLDRIDHRGYTAQDLRERLARGHLGLALKHEGKVAAFTWCNFDEIQFEPCRRALDPGEAYLYDAHTLEAYRGHRLAPCLRYQSYAALKTRGCRVLYSTSDCLNRSAVQFKRKMNATFLFMAIYFELFGRCKKTWVVRRYGQSPQRDWP